MERSAGEHIPSPAVAEQGSGDLQTDFLTAIEELVESIEQNERPGRLEPTLGDFLQNASALPVAVLVTGPDGTILFQNPAASTLLSIPQEQTSLGACIVDFSDGFARILECTEKVHLRKIELRLPDAISRVFQVATVQLNATRSLLIVLAPVLTIASDRIPMGSSATVGQLALSLAGKAGQVKPDIVAALLSRLGARHDHGRKANHYQRDIINGLIGEAKRLQAALSDLRTLVNPPWNGPAANPVGALLSQALSPLSQEAQRYGAGLLTESLSDPSIMIAMGEQAFQELMLRIVRDSARACGQGATIRLGWQKLSAFQRDLRFPGFPGDVVVFSICDKGPPHAYEDPEEVLFPKARSDGRGQAFELSIARKIVSIHGGILVPSQASDGTSMFQIYLPLATTPGHANPACRRKSIDQEAPEGCVMGRDEGGPLEERVGCSRCAVYRAQDLSFFATPIDQWQSGKNGESKNSALKGRVLIADHDKQSAWALAHALSRGGFGVSVCPDGTEAFHALQFSPPNVLITRAHLPGQSGLTLLDWIHKNRPEIDVVVVSAHSSARLREWCLSRGALMFLQKPFDLDLLLQSLCQWRNVAAPSSPPPDGSRRLLQVINESIASGSGGEIVVRSGSEVGRIFLVGQCVAWVWVQGQKPSLSQTLIDEVGPDPTDLRTVYEECKRTGANFAETLVQWHLVEHDRMREILQQRFARCLAKIWEWPDVQTMFVPQRRTYHSMLLFEFSKVLETMREYTNSEDFLPSMPPSCGFDAEVSGLAPQPCSLVQKTGEDLCV